MTYIQIIPSDVLEGLKIIEDKSIDCIVTSPPYWNLKDYQWNDQWGLEDTYQEYLDHLWKFMGEAYRILKDEGTAFINLADTYDSDKNLLLIPHRFAIGCKDRSWICRNDIVWSSKNKMPESSRDRFSRKKEYFFFFVKQKKYYFDLDSIRNKIVTKEKRTERIQYQSSKNDPSGRSAKFLPPNPKGKNPGDVIDFWEEIEELDNMPEMLNVPTKASRGQHFAMYNEQIVSYFIKAGCPENGVVIDPFAGSGTTLFTAKKLGRNVIGIEGKKDYVELIQEKMKRSLL